MVHELKIVPEYFQDIRTDLRKKWVRLTRY